MENTVEAVVVVEAEEEEIRSEWYNEDSSSKW